MRIKLLNGYASPRGTYQPGAVINVPDDEAAQLIDGHYAVLAPTEGEAGERGEEGEAQADGSMSAPIGDAAPVAKACEVCGKTFEKPTEYKRTETGLVCRSKCPGPQAAMPTSDANETQAS